MCLQGFAICMSTPSCALGAVSSWGWGGESASRIKQKCFVHVTQTKDESIVLINKHTSLRCLLYFSWCDKVNRGPQTPTAVSMGTFVCGNFPNLLSEGVCISICLMFCKSLDLFCWWNIKSGFFLKAFFPLLTAGWCLWHISPEHFAMWSLLALTDCQNWWASEAHSKAGEGWVRICQC